jgi:hypothetical protein
VETWPDSLDCPDLVACAPPGYQYIECARPRLATTATSMRINYDGVCLFYHCSLHARRVAFVDYGTFEFVCAYLTGSAVTILVVMVYRPGSAALSEFSDLFKRLSMYASSLIIAADLNIHLDVTSDPATVILLEVLELYSLVQHVTGPTHRAGHCLDVLITRRELCVHSVNVSPPMLSDHSCIVGRLDLLVPQDHSTVRRECRCWRQFDYDSFYADLCQSEMVRDPSSSHSVAELLDRYDSTLRSLLDVHAPVRTICIRAPRLLHGTMWIVGVRRKKPSS